jgi:cystathionine gamma-synthase
MHLETKAIHAGLDIENNSSAVVPPMHPSTVFEHSKKGFQKGDLNYARYSNPNRLQLEALIAALEEGEACAAFSSGVAAATGIFQALKPGDHVLIPADVYAGNRSLIKKVMQPWNLEADFIDMTALDNISESLRENTRLIWIETPSNPLMNITDIQAVCKLARDNEILTCVDNTWPSPVNQLPLQLEADLVLHSTTKYFGGHSDILGGAVVAKQKEGIFRRIREVQQLAGAVPSPRDCWLLCRSTRTLSYRMHGHNEHAAQLAEFLQEHRRVKEVFFPGLATHPGHEIAQKQMSGFGGMISFLIDGDADDALSIVAGSTLIKRASSLGGVESTWEHRRSSEGKDSVAPENLIRISVGLEHPDDLIEDLERALDI